MTKLEECARALARRVVMQVAFDAGVREPDKWQNESIERTIDRMWKDHVLDAITVIRCLMEPSEGMKTAAFDVEMKEACEGDPTTRHPDDADILRAMLQSVLDGE